MVTAQPPFRHLWVWILVLAGLAVVAFWPRYFGVFGTANWRLHVHGISAMAWMFLVALQAGLIHARKAAAHRWVAMSSVVVVPIFLVGGLLAVQTQGDGEGPFHQMFGPSLVAVDLLTMGLFAFLFAAGLATRSRPQLHARYMVGTLLPLIGPVGARLLVSYMPGLTMRGLADMPRFGPAFHIANGGFVLLLCAGLYARAPRHGLPFVLIGAVALVQSVLFATLLDVPAWAEVALAMSKLPTPLFVAAGLALGTAAVVIGWRRGLRSLPHAAN